MLASYPGRVGGERRSLGTKLDSYQLQLIAMGLRELSDQQEPTLGLVREVLSIVQRILERNDQDTSERVTRHLLLVRG